MASWILVMAGPPGSLVLGLRRGFGLHLRSVTPLRTVFRTTQTTPQLIGDRSRQLGNDTWIPSTNVDTIKLMFSWDERKRRANIRKHGIDFADCGEVFDGPTLSNEDRREEFGELRIRTFGLLKDTVVLVVWAPGDDNTIHLISARKGDRHESKQFWRQQRH